MISIFLKKAIKIKRTDDAKASASAAIEIES